MRDGQLQPAATAISSQAQEGSGLEGYNYCGSSIQPHLPGELLPQALRLNATAPSIHMAPQVSDSHEPRQDVEVVAILNKVARALQQFHATCARIAQDPESAPLNPSLQKTQGIARGVGGTPCQGKFQGG